MSDRYKQALFLPFALLLLAAACDSPSDVESGTLTVMLTDAPGDVLEAWVMIQGVELVGGHELEGEGEGDIEGQPVQLLAEPVTTDLLTLVDQAQTLVSDAAVAAGAYRQMRFDIPAACIVVEGSDAETDVYSSDPEFLECGTPTGTLTIPSYGTSGLKVILPGAALTVEGGESTTMTVDFDVAESFGQIAGQSGGWVMNPVLRGSTP